MDRISELLARAAELPATITAATPAADAERIEAQHAAMLEEIDNLRQTQQICRAENLDWTKFQHMGIGEAKGAVFDALRARSEQNPTFTVSSFGLSGELVDRAGEDFLYSRLVGKRPTGAAERFSGQSLVEFGRQLLEANGARNIPRDRTRLIDTMMLSTRAGYMTTSDFPSLLLGAGNRVLQESYQLAATPLLQLARTRSAADFRTLSSLRMSAGPELLEVNESGEIKHGAPSESTETYRIRTWGRIFSLTRQALANDDLDGFGQLLRSWGAAAARVQADELWSLFSANSGAGQDLADGTPLFDASRGNLADSGGAPSVTSLSAARAALRTTTDLDGASFLNLMPKFLLAGPAMETTAEQLLAALAPAVVDAVNPFNGGKMQLLIEPRIADNAWYVFADPLQAAVIEVAYLDGVTEPQLVEKDGFEVLGREYRLTYDFGAGLLGWRGAYLNTGA
jgi:hypothetical protein